DLGLIDIPWELESKKARLPLFLRRPVPVKHKQIGVEYVRIAEPISPGESHAQVRQKVVFELLSSRRRPIIDHLAWDGWYVFSNSASVPCQINVENLTGALRSWGIVGIEHQSELELVDPPDFTVQVIELRLHEWVLIAANLIKIVIHRWSALLD